MGMVYPKFLKLIFGLVWVSWQINQTSWNQSLSRCSRVEKKKKTYNRCQYLFLRVIADWNEENLTGSYICSQFSPILASWKSHINKVSFLDELVQNKKTKKVEKSMVENAFLALNQLQISKLIERQCVCMRVCVCFLSP